MALVALENVSIRFPILHMGHRSLKKSLVASATGGAILQDAQSAPIVEALKTVSLTLKDGDRIGLVGSNGSGKSTLLRTIAGIYEPDTGDIHVTGKVMPLLDLGLGFDNELTGRENIRLRGMYLGIKPSKADSLVPEIIDFSELGSYIDLPVRTYSSGMMMRLSLGVATAMEPDILLMDEWLMAGDAHFVQKARARLVGFIKRARIMMLASHSEDIIHQWCNKAMLLKSGRVLAFGSVDEVFRAYGRNSS